MGTLLSAIVCLTTLVHLHVTYVTYSSSPKFNCLLHAVQQELLKHQIDFLDKNGTGNSVGMNYIKDHYDLISLKIVDGKESFYSFYRRFGDYRSGFQNTSQMVEVTTNLQYENGTTCMNNNHNSLLTQKEPIVSNKTYTTIYSNTTDYIFSFHRGILMLTQEKDILRQNFNVLEISLQSGQCSCMGNPFTVQLLRQTIGYDIVVMNWVIASFGGGGHLYNLKSKELFNLNFAAEFASKKGVSMHESHRRERRDRNFLIRLSDVLNSTKRRLQPIMSSLLGSILDLLVTHGFANLPLIYQLKALNQYINSSDIFLENNVYLLFFSELWQRLISIGIQFNQFLAFRVGVFFSTSFLFFICTTLVSYLLRETQERMLKFTYLLQYHITHNLPYLPLVFTHVVESLVFVPIMMGTYFFLFEFFSDQLLAFLVLLVVWMGEVFSVLSARSRVTIRYFPRIFCYYFYLFHVYFFSYPFGFSYIALSALFLFVLHATMHFWNVYEVPIFERGGISSAYPRQGFQHLIQSTAATTVVNGQLPQQQQPQNINHQSYPQNLASFQIHLAQHSQMNNNVANGSSTSSTNTQRNSGRGMRPNLHYPTTANTNSSNNSNSNINNNNTEVSTRSNNSSTQSTPSRTGSQSQGASSRRENQQHSNRNSINDNSSSSGNNHNTNNQDPSQRTSLPTLVNNIDTLIDYFHDHEQDQSTVLPPTNSSTVTRSRNYTIPNASTTHSVDWNPTAEAEGNSSSTSNQPGRKSVVATGGRHHITLTNIYESVESRRMRLSQQQYTNMHSYHNQHQQHHQNHQYQMVSTRTPANIFDSTTNESESNVRPRALTADSNNNVDQSRSLFYDQQNINQNRVGNEENESADIGLDILSSDGNDQSTITSRATDVQNYNNNNYNNNNNNNNFDLVNATRNNNNNNNNSINGTKRRATIPINYSFSSDYDSSSFTVFGNNFEDD